MITPQENFTAYRFEHKETKVGPFRTDKSQWKWKGEMWKYLEMHNPMPSLYTEIEYSAVNPREPSEFFCAYLSKEDFFQYWPPEIRNGFVEYGFQLVELSLEKCYTSKHQCFFLPCHVQNRRVIMS